MPKTPKIIASCPGCGSIVLDRNVWIPGTDEGEWLHYGETLKFKSSGSVAPEFSERQQKASRPVYCPSCTRSWQIRQLKVLFLCEDCDEADGTVRERESGHYYCNDCARVGEFDTGEDRVLKARGACMNCGQDTEVKEYRNEGALCEPCAESRGVFAA